MRRLWFGLVLLGSVAFFAWDRSPPERAMRASERGEPQRVRETAVPVDEGPGLLAQRKSREAEEFLRELEAEEAAGEEGSREGRVLDAAGEPIANATVDFGQRVIPTDEQGRFTFDWSADDGESLTFVVRHHEHLDSREERKRDGDELVFRMRRGASIRGVLVYADGKPLPGERIDAVCGRSDDKAAVWTDEQGRFELRGFPAEECVVSAKVSDGITVRAGGDPIRLIARESRVEIRVLGLDRSRYEFARIRILRRNLHDGSRIVQHTGGGPHRFTPVPGMEYKVIVTATNHRPETVLIAPFDERPRYQEVLVRPRRGPPGKIRLTVTRGNNKRTHAVHIAIPDRDGDLIPLYEGNDYTSIPIEVGGLDPGPVRIHVWERTHPQLVRRITVTASEAPEVQRIVLPKGALVRIRGVVGARRCSLRVEHGTQYLPMRRFKEEWVSRTLLPEGRYRVELFERGTRLREDLVELKPGIDAIVDWTE